LIESFERTLVLVKPDGVQRGLIGEIISRLERRGLKIIAAKLVSMNEEMARAHYSAHAEKPFFQELVTFITSGPLLAMIWEGDRAVHVVRNTMGATDPVDADQGTIRGDFAIAIGRNLVHGSDSKDAAVREIGIFFNKDEIIEYETERDRWIIEL